MSLLRSWLFGGTAYPNISFKTISGVIAALLSSNNHT
uniref:Uncharacterized protein n=1 Tax=Myoviridae sp. ct2Pw37 TaxID=2825021 RepID=A0A8S5P9S3_9CAUD|nr:MAG TPA: hypothetical protein [Myoviridae sp. ct2Pw37]